MRVSITALFLFSVTAFSKDWTSDISCFGKVMNGIDLSGQFDAAKQQEGGTCYAYSAVAVVEAGLYRQTKTTHNLSAEYAIADTCQKDIKGLTLRSNTYKNYAPSMADHASQASFLNYFGGSPQWLTIQNILAAERLPYSSPEISKAYRKLTAQIGGTILRSQVKLQEKIAEIPELQAQKEELKEQLKQKYMDINSLEEKEEGFLDPSLTTDDEARKAKNESNIKEAQKAIDDLEKKVLEVDLKLQAIEKETAQTDQSNALYVCSQMGCFKKTFADAKSANLSGLINIPVIDPDYGAGCPGPNAQERYERIKKGLCLGVPLGFGISGSPDSLARSASSDKWEPHPLQGGHAMVITGLKKVNGKVRLIARNSWGPGSEMSLPLEDLCNINELNAVVNTDAVQGESKSEAQAYIDNDKEFFEHRLQSGMIKETPADDKVVKEPKPNASH